MHVELLDFCPYFLGMALGAVQSSMKCLLSTSGSAIKSQHPSSCAAAPCEIPAVLEASTREGCYIQHLFLCSDLLSAEEESLDWRVSCEIKNVKNVL